MPRVPTYESQVRTQAMPNARITANWTPDALGAADGEGLQSIGAGIAKAGMAVERVLQEEQAKKNETDVTAALNQLDSKSADAMRRARDPAAGVRGQSTADDVKRFMDEFDTADRDVAKSLTDPNAQRIYRMRADARKNQFSDALMTHGDKVSFDYANEQDEGQIKAANEQASLYYDVPSRVAAMAKQRQNAIDRIAERNNLTPERKAAMLLDKQSSGHRIVVGEYLRNGRLGEAKALAESIPDHELTAADRAAIKDGIKVETTKATAQNIADQVFAEGLAGSAAQKRMRELAGDDMEAFDQAVTRWTRVKTLEEDAKRERENAAFVSAYTTLEQSGGDMTKIPGDALMKLSPENQMRLRSIGKAMAADAKPETDPMTWLELQGKSAQDLAKMDELAFYGTYKDKLSPEDFQRMAVVWGNAREASRQPAKKAALDEFISTRDQIGNAMVAGGVKPTGAAANRITEDQAMAMADFEAEASRRLSEAQDLKGGKLTGDERQKVLDGLALESFRAKGKNEPPPWQRRMSYSQIKKHAPEVLTRMRQRAVALGNKDPEDEAIEQAVEAAKIGAPATQIDAILSGK